MKREVLRIADTGDEEIGALLARFGLRLEIVRNGSAIPGSFWGDSEAGLKGMTVYARLDTPLHSVLHEACHAVCMAPERRAELDCDAGGDYDEENAVCYLQILLAGRLSELSPERMCEDMDAWGYTFRLGSARAWFERDADDALAWLRHENLVDAAGNPTWQCRGAVPAVRSC
ncbi:MAG: hypothetical protein AAFN78_07160 [Pseudomonadota bacterium]